MPEFEWDEEKREANLEKHGISFVAAIKIFLSDPYIERSDRNSESRYIAVGEVKGRILTVAYTLRGDRIRIISARRARKNEEKKYRQLHHG